MNDQRKNPLEELFTALGDTVKQAENAGTAGKNDIPDELKTILDGMMKNLGDLNKKDFSKRTAVDAQVVRELFKNIPGISGFVDQLSDEEINAGPEALFKKFSTNEMMDSIKGSEGPMSAGVNKFMKAAKDMINDMDTFEKDHGIDTSGDTGAAGECNECTNCKETTTRVHIQKVTEKDLKRIMKINRSPHNIPIIGIILEMGGNPADFVKLLNKIAEKPKKRDKCVGKIMGRIAEGNEDYKNVSKCLADEAGWNFVKLIDALKKDHIDYQERHPQSPKVKETERIVPDSKIEKKIKKIKKRFFKGKIDGAETVIALTALMEDAKNPAMLNEIIVALLNDIDSTLTSID